MARIVNVNNYLPPVVKDAREFKRIADAENPEFNIQWENIDVLWANQYVMESTIEGVERWEKIINIIPRANDTLQDRKIRILSYINRTLPFTMKVLLNYLESACGSGNYSAILDPIAYTLKIHTVGLSAYAMEDVMETFDIMIPANIIYTHTNLEG
ncbi:MAG: YmfQ family protein [Alphaproteobacteria bacterium]|nr:YmfQ family protein [Alphaproteobacteria bacterium]